ncbi:alpha/beta hydrolase [bacterium]|nr:MAG: alpha/beta hydrolase [bacterium]
MNRPLRTLALTAATLIAALAFAQETPMKETPKGQYAQVNGLKMYYEIHGTGKPLVLLHGSFGTADGWSTILPTLEKERQMIVVELRGHGRTEGVETPLTPEAMADDTAALLKHLKIEKADVFGYSMGGKVALALAIRHPEAVRKMAILGAAMGSMKDTFTAEAYNQFLSITPENFNFAAVKDPYTKVSPHPEKWPDLVKGIVEGGRSFKGFTEEQVRGIQAPTLVMLGDREGIKLEHVVEMYRTLPNAQLAIFSKADHFLLYTGADRVLGTLVPFLEAE